MTDELCQSLATAEISRDQALSELRSFDWRESNLEEQLAQLGSSSPSYFLQKRSGGLLLQQVPAELAALIQYLKQHHSQPRKYLEIGIGSCGTLIVLNEFWRSQGKPPLVFAADNFSYSTLPQRERFEWARSMYGISAYFGDTKEAAFREFLKPHMFDLIFVDGDHSFEGCVSDVVAAYPYLAPDGSMILHDVTSDACPGVVATLSFAKKYFRHVEVFSASRTCGIAVLRVKTHRGIPAVDIMAARVKQKMRRAFKAVVRRLPPVDPSSRTGR